MFFFLFTVHLQSLVLSMHSTWTLVPVSPGALTSYQQLNSNRVTKNMKISISVVCTFEMPLVLDRVTALNW